MSTDLVALPPSVTSRGLDVAAWNTLCNSLFPGAKPDSVLMAVDYCKARQLDVMKKPCHIVPISVKEGDSWKYRDVVMPGIYEYRITAHRTNQYLGHTKPEYGDEDEFFGVEAPAWCEMVMKRWHEPTGQTVEYPVRVYFREVCATKKIKGRDGEPDTFVANERWSRAPIQMLTKCCEAAGLREAFPDELGGTQTDDEMYGRIIEAEVVQDQPAPAKASRKKPQTTEPQATDFPPEDNITAGAPAGGDQTERRLAVADRIIKSQQTLIEQRLKRANIPESEFLATFEIGQVSELLFDHMQEASDWIVKRSQEQR